MSRRRRPAADWDSPWKDALLHFLKACLAFFFPQAHAAIDWSRGYETLDKELRQIVPEAESGRAVADTLFKVWLKDGGETWLLVHVEIQGQPVANFPWRMFDYHARILQRYNREVMSLAVLTDDRPSWRPDRFGYEHGGCELSLKFPIAKLLDYAGREAELEASANPFAAVVLAHLEAKRTKDDPETRRHEKVRLVKGLYRRGWSAEDVRQLFRLVDWLMALPAELQDDFREEVDQFEREQRMPWLSSIERLAKEEGRQEGLEEGRQEGLREGLLRWIASDLHDRFGVRARRLLAKVKALKETEQLEAFALGLKSAATLDEARRLLP